MWHPWCFLGYAGYFATYFKWWSSELIKLNFGVAIFGGVCRCAPPLKMSGIGNLWILGLCRTFCSKFQVITIPADLAQFWVCHQVPLPTWPHPPVATWQTTSSLYRKLYHLTWCYYKRLPFQPTWTLCAPCLVRFTTEVPMLECKYP